MTVCGLICRNARFEVESEIEFELGANDIAGNPIKSAQFEIKLKSPDGTETPIQVIRRSEKYFGRIKKEQLNQAGYFTIAATGSNVSTVDGTKRTIGSTRVEFIAVDNDREKANPGADPDLLARLSSYTAEWGGRSVTPDEFGRLLDEISESPVETKIEVPQKWRLGDSFNDALTYVLIFVAVLTGEWVLRKNGAWFSQAVLGNNDALKKGQAFILDSIF